MHRRTGLLAVILTVLAACAGSGPVPGLRAQRQPHPSPDYRVIFWSVGDLGRRVPVTATIENVGDAAATPICFYT